jgi:hypothetical protein
MLPHKILSLLYALHAKNDQLEVCLQRHLFLLEVYTNFQAQGMIR